MKKITAVVSACVMLASGISAMPVSAEPPLYGTTYFSEYMGNHLEADESIGVNYVESYEAWQAFLDAEARTSDYLGAYYNGSIDAASPPCDTWQLYRKGTNCTGFVWHIITNGLVHGLQDAGLNVSTSYATDPTAFRAVCKYVPNNAVFNSNGYSRSSSGRWGNMMQSNQIHYYEFTGANAKQDMLSSGVLHKGDVIWCVDPTVGSGWSGLLIPANQHHVGIYFGDGSNDLWWHSGISGSEKNAIEAIRCGYSKCTYVVVPWNAVTIQDEAVTMEDVMQILTYYARQSAGLMPDWESVDF